MADFKICFYCHQRYPGGAFFDKHLKICSHRNKGELSNSWKCPKCDFANGPEQKKCTMCNFQRPAEGGQSEVQKSKPVQKPEAKPGWRCLDCTFLNSNATDVCNICKKPKPGKDSFRARQAPGNGGARRYVRRLVRRPVNGPPNQNGQRVPMRGGPFMMGPDGRVIRGPPPAGFRGLPPPNGLRRGPPLVRGGRYLIDRRTGRRIFVVPRRQPVQNGRLPVQPSHAAKMPSSELHKLPPIGNDEEEEEPAQVQEKAEVGAESSPEVAKGSSPPPPFEQKSESKEMRKSVKEELPEYILQALENVGGDEDTMLMIKQLMLAELCNICQQQQGSEMSCSHRMCLVCCKTYVLNGIQSERWRSETVACPINNCGQPLGGILKQCLSDEQLEKLDQMQMEIFLKQTGSKMVQCPKCHEHFMAEIANIEDMNHQETDEKGRVLTEELLRHKAENRFRCAKCQTKFCGACKAVPYHLGRTCEDFANYSKASKCRFCEAELTKDNVAAFEPGLGEGLQGNVCTSEDCLDKRIWSCDLKLACGHNCIGLKGRDCLECINPDCVPKKDATTDQELCNICWVDPLVAAPTLKLKCTHYFHFKCLWNKIDRKWPAARITFGFLNCPLCKREIQDPALADITEQYYKLKDKIKVDAVERLRVEGLDSDPRLKDKASPYFENIEKFAMDRLAFYKCFKCNNPYFGGMKACEEAGAEQEEKYVQEHLVCGSCASGPNAKSCAKHGKKFITYKCKFCCSISQWFCWGSTHFCDNCHKRQESGDYLNRKPISELPVCPGPGKCPLGIEHPPNGVEEFSLGCVVCLRK